MLRHPPNSLLVPARFYIQATADGFKTGNHIELNPERSHYLCKVMRLRAGQHVSCFDGCGTCFDAIVVTPDAKHAVLQVTAVSPLQSATAPAIHLGMSILKGQAMDRALQQATELGVTEITLLNAQRSNVKLKRERADHKLEHWQKILQSACEQCGQLHVPRLNPPVSAEQFLAQLGAASNNAWVLEQTGNSLPLTITHTTVTLLIGPEGGWDKKELALFEQHKLGIFNVAPFTLRAETVPAVALALIHHAFRQKS